MKKRIRLTESDLHRMVKESVKTVLKEMRRNRPLEDYADEITQKWRNSMRGDDDREDIWHKYQALDRMERIHALRNGKFPTASYQGVTYTIDDSLPQNAPIFVHYTGAPYAWNVYPNGGESLRDYIEGRGESMEDITDWWIED